MNQLLVITIHNPLDPRDCSRESRPFTAGQTLAEMFPDGGVALKTQLAYSLNGQVIEREQMAVTRPTAGDSLVVCPIPEGGNGKNILRIAAMIAVMVVAPQLGALYGSFAGATLGIGVTGWTAIFSVAGMQLVNALLPPPKPASESSSYEESATYGIDGAKNTSAEGVVVPVVYGTHRMGGNIIQNYVTNDGDIQYLHMLMAVGEGPIGAIERSSILINDQPLTSYVAKNSAGADVETVWIETRTGERDQAPIPWFDDVLRPVSVQQKITENWKVITTSALVDSWRLDFVAQGGLFRANDQGNLESASVELELQYRKEGTTTWLPMPSTNKISGGELVTTYVYPGYAPNGHEYVVNGLIYRDDGGGDTMYSTTGDPLHDAFGNIIYNYPGNVIGHVSVKPDFYGVDGKVVLTASKRTAYRYSTFAPKMAPGVYEIRYRRTNAESAGSALVDSVYLSEINEIVKDDIGYVNTALLGLRIQLTDQLNGIPAVTHINHGKRVRMWDVATGTWQFRTTNNPAWHTLDILTNARYGGGIPLSRIDIARWKEWAAWCDLKGLEFHGVFDTASNVWDAAVKTARLGRAMPMTVGTKVTVVIDRQVTLTGATTPAKPETPVMGFSVANMIAGTFKETWLPMDSRANEIEISFPDAADDYKTRTIRVVDRAAAAIGTKSRPVTLQMMGLVSAQRAFEEAMLMLNSNRYLIRTVEFSAPIEAIGCSVGSVIWVQHDMPKWGSAGRLAAGSTTSALKLDRPVVLTAGKSYQAMVQFDALKRAQGTVAWVSGDMVALNGFNGAATQRLKVGGKDFAVQGTFQSGALYGVTLVSGALADMTNLAATEYELWDTNVMETRAVFNPAMAGQSVELSEITLMMPASAAGEVFTKWMFGESNKVSKPFRVRSIAGTHEYRRDITAIEYVDAAYDATGETVDLNYSQLSGKAVEHATILSVTEQQVLVGTSYENRVTLHFGSTQATYKDSLVFLRRNGGAVEQVGYAREQITVTGAKGEYLRFYVQANDVSRNAAPLSGSPTWDYVVSGRSAAPGQLENFTIGVSDAGLVAAWSKPQEADWVTTEIRSGSSWEDGVKIFSERLTSITLPWATSTGIYKLWGRHWIPGVAAAVDAAASIAILPPEDVSFGVIAAALGSAMLRWQDCKTTQPLRRYVIRVGAIGEDWSALTDYAAVAGGATSATLTFLTSGTRRVWVVAEDMGGNMANPRYIDVTVSADMSVPDLTPPPKPTGFVALAGFAKVGLTWPAPAYTQGHGHKEAVIYSAQSAAGAYTEIGTTTSTAWDDVPGVGVTAFYKLAFRSSDDVLGQLSDAVSATTTRLGGADLTPLSITAGQLADAAVDLASNKVTGTITDPVRFGATAVGYTVTQYLLATSGLMQNLMVDDAQILNLNVGKLTAGSLSVGRFIQSQNYTAGANGTGWRINADGSAELQAQSIRGLLTASQIDGRGLSIKDAAGNVILAAGSALPAGYSSTVTAANMLQNSAFAAVTGEWNPAETMAATDPSVPPGAPSQRVLRSTIRDNYARDEFGTVKRFPVQPNEVLEVEVWIGLNAPIDANVGFIRFSYDMSGGDLAYYPGPSIPGDFTGWRKVTGRIEVRSDQYGITPVMWISQSGQNYEAFFSEPVMRRLPASVALAGTTATWGNINGDGKPQDNATYGATIGTNLSGKIDGSNVSTFIADAAIGSAQIDRINANQVSAVSLSAITANIGTLRTASSGARTEIRDNVIKVYDASNVLRVRIGDLSL